MRYRFGPFVADREAYQLRRDDRALSVTPKLLDLLFYLLERPATLVTKEELLEAVWPDANVTDNALAQAVSELRDALGDAAASPTYIRTVARRGYRFIAPVESTTRPAAGATADPGSSSTPPPDERAIAVLDFENVTGDPDVAWLAAGIAETVTNDLSALGPLRVIDRWRVQQTVRVAGGSLPAVAAALGEPLLVIGSYQRQGTHIRITSRVLDARRGEPVADVKVDGTVDAVFTLQDEIVASFARAMGLRRTGAAPASARETSNLAAYRAYIEGWLTIETLDTSLLPQAMDDFERAVRLDPTYTMAYTGLANAKFATFEMARATEAPDFDALGSGIAYARRAVELDPESGEAHSTLSFLLVSAMQHEEARTSARRAVALEPDNWRHQYRLAHASWGSARLRALDRTLTLFPQFPYAVLEAAILHTARGDLRRAEEAAQQGAIEQDRQAQLGHRYPAVGFHWLLGALESAAGRHEAAIACFNRELATSDPNKLYGPEYAAESLVSRGFAQLHTGHAAAALASCRAAREHVPGFPRAFVGEYAATRALGRQTEAATAAADIARACDILRRTRRGHEALYVEACHAAMQGDGSAAFARLRERLDRLIPSQVGWTTPIEPAFMPLRRQADFQQILDRIRDRAQ